MNLERFINKSNKVRAIALFLTGVLSVASFAQNVYAVKSISQLEQEKGQLQDEVQGLDEELVSVLTSISELEASIATTEQEIKDAEEDLKIAQDTVNQQYDSMKTRIRYMYANGNQDMFTIFVTSGSISDFINKVSYANRVYEYDREQLDRYRAMVEEIQEMKNALEEEKIALQADKNQLAAQKKALNNEIATKRAQIADFDRQLEQARAAAAAAARQAAESTSSNSNTSKNAGSQTSGGNKDPAQKTGISGSSVVGYAKQFVGNPYVWGGDSLTNGCDCSGFVQQVYANFGIKFGSRMTSASFRTVGQEVSYENMKAGDIVCYAGHVAIYDGNGHIVEAQSTRAGITANRSVNKSTILAIRRVI